MGKIDDMVNSVEDGPTQLIGENEAQETTEDVTIEAQQPDPLNLEQPDEKKKPETPVKSYLSEDDEETETPELPKPDRFVPVREIQKEREKRKTLEQENAELKARLESKAIQTDSLDDDLDGLLSDPDDLIDGKTARRLAEQTAKKAVEQYAQQIASQQAQNETKAQAQQREQQLIASQNEARKRFADFDQVVSNAVDSGLLTPGDLRDIKSSKNPGTLLYAKSRERLSIIGNLPSEPGTKQKETPDSDNIYEVMYGGPAE